MLSARVFLRKDRAVVNRAPWIPLRDSGVSALRGFHPIAQE